MEEQPSDVLRTVRSRVRDARGEHAVAEKPFQHTDQRGAYAFKMKVGAQLSQVAHLLEQLVGGLDQLQEALGHQNHAAFAPHSAALQQKQQFEFFVLLQLGQNESDERLKLGTGRREIFDRAKGLADVPPAVLKNSLQQPFFCAEMLDDLRFRSEEHTSELQSHS